MTFRISIIACLLALPAAAQSSRHITLDEAVQLSIQNSKQLKLSQARIAEATANYKEATDRRLPDLTVSGSYLRLAQPDVELKIKLGNGGGSEGGSAAPSQVAYGLANASLPIFAGFKIQSGIESSRLLAQAARLDADGDRQAVIINTTSAYSNLFKAREAVRLVQQSLANSQQRVKDYTRLEQNGIMARNDLLKAQLQQSNVELSLLDAENNLHITNINMDLLLGLPEGTEIVTDSTFNASDDTRTMLEWEALALQRRSDVTALDIRRKAAQQGIRAARGDYYPSVALTGGYIGAYVENVLTIKDAFNAGIGIQYAPSSFWKTSSKVAQARARLQQVEANQAILSDAIRIQVAQAYENYILSRRKIEVYAQAVEQAQENYRIINNKYANQLATATDVLDADVAQLQASLNYSFSKADASVSYQRLLQTAGIIDTTTH